MHHHDWGVSMLFLSFCSTEHEKEMDNQPTSSSFSNLINFPIHSTNGHESQKMHLFSKINIK